MFARRTHQQRQLQARQLVQPGEDFRILFLALAESQTRIVLSQPPEAIRRLSGLNVTLQTALLCPWRVRISRPVAASQTFTV